MTERSVEQIMSVLQFQEQPGEISTIIPQKFVYRTEKQIAHVRFFLTQEEIVEVIAHVPVIPAPQEHIQEHIVEHTVAILVPQVKHEIHVMWQTQERFSEAILSASSMCPWRTS